MQVGIIAPSYPLPANRLIISELKKHPIMITGMEKQNKALVDLLMSSLKASVWSFDSIALARGITTVVHAVYNDMVRIISFDAVVKKPIWSGVETKPR